MYWHFSKHKSILSNTSLFLRPTFMLLKTLLIFLKTYAIFTFVAVDHVTCAALNVTSTNQLRDAFPADTPTNKQIQKTVLAYKRYSPRGSWWGRVLLTFKLVSRTHWRQRTVNGVVATRCNTVSATQLLLNRKENSYTTIIHFFAVP
jgi:hypothetical protein